MLIRKTCGNISIRRSMRGKKWPFRYFNYLNSDFLQYGLYNNVPLFDYDSLILKSLYFNYLKEHFFQKLKYYYNCGWVWKHCKKVMVFKCNPSERNISWRSIIAFQFLLHWRGTSEDADKYEENIWHSWTIGKLIKLKKKKSQVKFNDIIVNIIYIYIYIYIYIINFIFPNRVQFML